jgi:hypothetical protein
MIEFKGLLSGNAADERTKLSLSVTLDDDTFDWFLMVPPSADWRQYLVDSEQEILDAVQAKITEWETTSPTTIIIDDITGEQTEVPISKQDFVKPDYPDYWVKRKQAYPALAEQLGAIWKGGDDQQAMSDLIVSIKEQYPKP